jgi:mRNA interferase RelE/StbE
MTYQVGLARSAEREFHALGPAIRRRMSTALIRLESEPRGRGSRKLAQGPGWRLRVGDYRVLYEVDDEAGVVTVYAIGHRRDVYRR